MVFLTIDYSKSTFFTVYNNNNYVGGTPGDLELQLAGISVWVARQETWRSSWRVYLCEWPARRPGGPAGGYIWGYTGEVSVICICRFYLSFVAGVCT